MKLTLAAIAAALALAPAARADTLLRCHFAADAQTPAYDQFYAVTADGAFVKGEEGDNPVQRLTLSINTPMQIELTWSDAAGNKNLYLIDRMAGTIAIMGGPRYIAGTCATAQPKF